jgi:hypothetical protein
MVLSSSELGIHEYSIVCITIWTRYGDLQLNIIRAVVLFTGKLTALGL